MEHGEFLLTGMSLTAHAFPSVPQITQLVTDHEGQSSEVTVGSGLTTDGTEFIEGRVNEPRKGHVEEGHGDSERDQETKGTPRYRERQRQ